MRYTNMMVVTEAGQTRENTENLFNSYNNFTLLQKKDKLLKSF